MRGKAQHPRSGVFFTTLAITLLMTVTAWRFLQITKADPPPISNSVSISALVLGCGDGLIEGGESCDGSNMNGNTCINQGYVSGSISCNPDCTLNTSSCSNTPVSHPPTTGTAVFIGLAYPNSTVNVLKGGQQTDTVTADGQGNFTARESNLSNGTYTFGFNTSDTAGNPSALTAVTVTVSGNTVTRQDIFLSPSIAPVASPVTPGDILNLTGESAAGASVTLTVTSSLGTVLSTKQAAADATGAYAATLDTTGLTQDTYTVTAVATLNGVQSTQSLPMSFSIGPAPVQYMKGDFSENQRVNLVDFSIALYWYKEPLTDAFKILEIRHGNGDGLLNLIDISIIAFFWTG